MQYNRTVGCVEIHIDTKRIDENIRNAQKLLNMQVAADCDPYVPYLNGALAGSVNYPDGMYGGSIEWNTPYAHYQYTGMVYGPNIPKYDDEGNLIGFWSPPHKHPEGRPLHYNPSEEHPLATDHWFERAKDTHGQQWIDLVKREVGKG
jgi:hypothetical protein